MHCIELLTRYLECDGIFLSNGPGDPSMCAATIEHLRALLTVDHCKPVFGICLGHQLMSLAAGASTYKMKYVMSCNKSVYEMATWLQTVRLLSTGVLDCKYQTLLCLQMFTFTFFTLQVWKPRAQPAVYARRNRPMFHHDAESRFRRR